MENEIKFKIKKFNTYSNIEFLNIINSIDFDIYKIINKKEILINGTVNLIFNKYLKFINYDDITKEQAIEWIECNLNITYLNAELDKLIFESLIGENNLDLPFDN